MPILTLFQHLSAFALPLILFGYWFILGYALLSLLHTQRNTLRNMFLAPGVGLALTIICIFNLSWFGLPVKTFAWPLCVVLLVLGIAILYYKKPLFPFRRYFPFFLIIIAALFIIGRPLLKFGFSWFSYANDDMTNYCLSAMRLVNHAYFDIPPANAITQGTDYASYTWIMFVPGLMRSGSELLLAWVTSLIGISCDCLFMPTIVALQLTLVQAIGALNYTTRRKRYTAFWGMGLYAAAALANLGVFYQLIAQVDGLTLLLISITLLFKDFRLKQKYFFRHALLCAIVLSAFALFYPELFSVFMLSAVLYFLLLMFTKKMTTSAFFISAGIILISFVILLHSYTINCFFTILDQTAHANLTTKISNSLFPYFLVPSGLANLWGFQALSELPAEPWLSLSIGLGGILLIIITLFAMVQVWRKQAPISMVFLVFLMMGMSSFYKNGDFALFKLAMYVQPFLWSLLAECIITFFSIKLFSVIFLSFIAINLWTNQSYINRSFGFNWDDVPHASKYHLAQQLDTMFKTLSPKATYLSDTTNIVLAKFEALHGKGYSLAFPGRNFFSQMVNHFAVDSHNYYRYLYFSHFEPHIIKESNKFRDLFNTTYQQENFYLNSKHSSYSYLMLPSQKSAEFLLKSSKEQSILNRWSQDHTILSNHKIIKAVPIKKIHNHLIFINSNLGEYYYLPDSGKPTSISLNRLERDYFYPDQTFSAINRYFLFNIVHPSLKPRMILNITTTLNSDRTNQLPPAIIVGDKQYALPIVGYGSARVFSPILTPQWINNEPYLMIDMQQNGKNFIVKEPTGLMALYGRNTHLDVRKLIGFARDISLVSDAEYQNIKAPAIINQFPADLNNPSLEYSGFYEDGWVGSDAYLYLTPETSKSTFKFKGFVPGIEHKIIYTSVTILIDNKKITEQSVSSGNFNFEIPVNLTVARHKVSFHFSRMIHLAGDDGRPASAKIDMVGFAAHPKVK